MATLTDQAETAEGGFRESVYGELADLLAQGGGPEAVLAFRSSEAVQKRAYELIDRKRDGSLTLEEERELNAFVDREHLLRLAKSRARMLVQSRTSASPSA
jgi:hypothetical protein